MRNTKVGPEPIVINQAINLIDIYKWSCKSETDVTPNPYKVEWDGPQLISGSPTGRSYFYGYDIPTDVFPTALPV